MPTIFIQKGYRFFFYPADLDEPIHVYVTSSGRHVKFWLQPVSVAVNGGFRQHELNEIERIIKRRSEAIFAAWEGEQRKRDDHGR